MVPVQPASAAAQQDQPSREQVPDEPGEVVAGTGRLSVSPAIAGIGDTITATYSNAGGVTWTMNAPEGGKCTGKAEKVTDEEELKHSVTGVKGGPTSCSWKATQGTRGWVGVTVSITGPCGDPEMVRQGKHEFASCAGAHADDHYYVLSEDHAISGRATLASGRGIPGVTIKLSGKTSGTAVTTASGNYHFIVPKGSYTVAAGGGVCLDPSKRGECPTGKHVSVPQSRTVNFKAMAEAVIDGTVRDAAGKPASGVTVRIIGRGGQVVTTDGDGYFKVEVPKGTYMVAATRRVEVQEKDEDGNTRTVSKVESFCSADEPRKCPKTRTVSVPPDATLKFGQGCEAKP